MRLNNQKNKKRVVKTDKKGSTRGEDKNLKPETLREYKERLRQVKRERKLKEISDYLLVEVEEFKNNDRLEIFIGSGF